MNMGAKVDAIEGFSLVDDDQIAKLANIPEGAEPNYIKAVDGQAFTVDEDGKLSLKELTVDSITNLQQALDNKVDKVTYTVDNGDGTSSEVQGTLLSPSDKKKLDNLTIDEEGKVGISGTVSASNVEGLSDWITNNRDVVPGLISTAEVGKLEGIEAGAQKNFISSVDTSVFSVDEGQLNLTAVPMSSVTGLVDMSTKVGSLESAIGDLQTSFNDLDTRLKWVDMTEEQAEG